MRERLNAPQQRDVAELLPIAYLTARRFANLTRRGIRREEIYDACVDAIIDAVQRCDESRRDTLRGFAITLARRACIALWRKTDRRNRIAMTGRLEIDPTDTRPDYLESVRDAEARDKVADMIHTAAARPDLMGETARDALAGKTLREAAAERGVVYWTIGLRRRELVRRLRDSALAAGVA